VLNAGRIEQVGSPLDLYRTPANLFVAGFIGSPRINLITGAEAGKLQAATVGVRPEHIRLSATEGTWSGTVGVAEHLGSDTLLHIESDDLGQITARADGEFPVKHGQRIYMTPDRARMHRFNEQGLAIR